MKKRNKKLVIALCSAMAAGAVIALPLQAEAAQVTFELNGGTWKDGRSSHTTYIEAKEKALGGNTVTMMRSNYYFAGYNTQANGKGTYYYLGEKVSTSANVSADTTIVPNDVTKLYAQWKQYKTTKTIDLSKCKFTQFTNTDLKGQGYYVEGAELYKVGNTKYLTASWIKGGSNVTKLVKFNYDTGKMTSVKTQGSFAHSNGMAYGNGKIYIAPGNGYDPNYIISLNESKLSGVTKIKIPNNSGMVDDWYTCQAVAYSNGKIFIEGPGGRMIIYNPTTKKVESQFFVEGLLGAERYNSVQGMAVNGNKLYLLACNSNDKVGQQKIFVYDYTAEKGNWKKEEWTITGTKDEIEDISFVDGKMYLIRGGNETFGVYDLSSSPAKKNGWYKENGKYKYYVDGKYYTGWHEFGKGTGRDTEEARHWTYFDSNGYLLTGWQKFGKGTGRNTNEATHWSYFGSNGWLVTGWQEFGKGTGRDTKETRHWTYFDANGWLLTGWQKFGKGTGRNTNEATHWSYFGGNGWLRTGWQQMGKGTSNPDGNAAKHWSYFGGNGWMRTGLQNFPKTSSEAAHKSYFGTNGWLRVNTTFTTGNVKYRADARGWLTKI